MNKDDVVLNLWEECKTVFLYSLNEPPDELLKRILEIVRENYYIFYEYADIKFLDYIIEIDVDELIIGTNGDDFELRLKSYIRQESISIEIIWNILAQLIWDLAVPVTENVCPFCHCDNLVVLVDKEKKHVYETCENCFYTVEDGIQIMRPKELFPANKDIIRKCNCRLTQR